MLPDWRGKGIDTILNQACNEDQVDGRIKAQESIEASGGGVDTWIGYQAGTVRKMTEWTGQGIPELGNYQWVLGRKRARPIHRCPVACTHPYPGTGSYRVTELAWNDLEEVLLPGFRAFCR